MTSETVAPTTVSTTTTITTVPTTITTTPKLELNQQSNIDPSE